MRRIGVISDTHVLLRPQALDALAGSDLILHAGDVGAPEILEALAEIAPVHAVHGNTDHGALRGALPREAVVDLGADDGTLAEDGPRGRVAYVIHIAEEVELDPAASGFGLVVTGHTHLPHLEERGGVLHLNPGSAGPRRFDYPVTVARLEVEDEPAGAEGDVRAEIVELGV